MALRQSNLSKNRLPAPSPLEASCPVTTIAEYTTVAGEFNAADVVEMIPWPAGTVPTTLVAVIPDIDSAAGVTLDFGVMSGQWLASKNDDLATARTCGAEFGNNLTTGQAGGVVVVTADLLLGLAPSAIDRTIGFKVETAATGLTAGAKIRVTATFAPVPPGIAFV